MAKAATKELVGDFQIEGETKNKKKYRETDDTQLVGTIYLRKEAAKELGDPEDIEVVFRAKQ